MRRVLSGFLFDSLCILGPHLRRTIKLSTGTYAVISIARSSVLYRFFANTYVCDSLLRRNSINVSPPYCCPSRVVVFALLVPDTVLESQVHHEGDKECKADR